MLSAFDVFLKKYWKCTNCRAREGSKDDRPPVLDSSDRHVVRPYISDISVFTVMLNFFAGMFAQCSVHCNGTTDEPSHEAHRCKYNPSINGNAMGHGGCVPRCVLSLLIGLFQ